MKLSFVKMHGAGNDFVMVDDRAETFPVDDASFIAKLANRPDGVGCEGVILVRPVKADATSKGDATSKADATSKGDATFLSRENKNSPTANFAMRFFNPDGSEADLCGNGARCVAAFALAIGAAPSRTMRFETRAGTVSAEVLDDGRVRIGMPQPKDLRKDFVNSGVPHAVVPVEDLAAADVAGEGRRIRHSEAFAPAGTNVDFVKWTGEHSLSIRTYERGVEAETFACGTGSVASALVGVAQYGLKFPVTVKTACGYELEIGGAWNGESFSDVTLTGPVKIVYEGEIETSAAVSSKPPYRVGDSGRAASMMPPQNIERTLAFIEKTLDEVLPKSSDRPAVLSEAMRYAVGTGGKRIRPLVCLYSALAVGGRAEDAKYPAAAIELLHNYTLIHDDLPAMDNDRERRGKPTVWVKFGEANAILAGDALLALAYRVAAKAPRNVAAIVDVLGEKGVGVVQGQVEDVAAELSRSSSDSSGSRLASPDNFIYIHKTSDLFIAAAAMGGLAGGGSESDVAALKEFALNLGLAFQYEDDLLDGDGIYDRETTAKLVNETTNAAIAALDRLPGDTSFLRELAQKLIGRKV